MTKVASDLSGILAATLLCISVFAIMSAIIWKGRRPRDSAALDLIARMSDQDQAYFQRLVTAEGKITAIKALRARFPVSLRTGKNAIELLDSVKPALLKFL